MARERSNHGVTISKKPYEHTICTPDHGSKRRGEQKQSKKKKEQQAFHPTVEEKQRCVVKRGDETRGVKTSPPRDHDEEAIS